jgi:fatty acid-binding protein DegV
MATWNGCKKNPDAVVNALRSAVANGKKVADEVINWLKQMKDHLLRCLIVDDNINWLNKMFKQWDKTPA